MAPYQIVRSKMAKTRTLLTDPDLARYIPKTVEYSPGNLAEMLKKYSHVYVKPDRGRRGNKVISVVLNHSSLCRIHQEKIILEDKTIDEAASYIERVAAGNSFIIQQAIQLLCIDRLPFDLRVNVQRPYNRWEVTAMIAKTMAPGKPVTNYSQGGKLVALDEALKLAGLDLQSINMVKKILTTLGEKAASVLSKKYRGLRELGMDIGLDQQVKPWILEVNTQPQYIRGHKKFDHYRRIIWRDAFRKY